MRKLVIIALLVLTYLNCIPQNINAKFDFGPEKSFSWKSFFYYLETFGNEGNVIFGINGGFNKPQLTRIESDLSTLKFEKYSFEQDHMSQENEKFIFMNNRILHFASFRNKKIDKVLLFYQEINKLTLLPSGEAKQLIQVDYSKENKYNNTQFFYKYSPDSTKFLIAHRIVLNDGSFSGFGIDVYDNTLNYLWSSGIENVVAGDNDLSMENWAISNSGDCYVLCKINDRQKQMSNFSFLRIKKNGVEKKEYPLTISNKMIKTIGISCNSKNEGICAGVYYNPNNQLEIGAFSAILSDKTDAQLIIHDAEAIKKSPEDEVPDRKYLPGDILFDNAGNFWFTAEQQKRITEITVNGMPGNNSMSSRYLYYNDNIYLVEFLADGTVLWQNKIIKNQYTNDDVKSWASYKAFCMNGQFYVFYNILPSRGNSFVKEKESYTILACYDKHGQEKTQKILSYQDNKVILTPRHSIILDNKTMIVPGIGESKYRLVKMTFE